MGIDGRKSSLFHAQGSARKWQGEATYNMLLFS